MQARYLPLVVSVLTTVGVIGAPTPASATFCPERVVHNALVYQGQGAWAEGFATAGQLIIAVGTSEEMLALANECPDTELLDAQGRLVVPGFNDAHIHAFPTTSFGLPINDPTVWMPGPGPDQQEVLGMLAGAASQLPPGTWLWVFVGNAILDDALHAPETAITRWDIDALTPDHPVVLMGWSGHGALMDSQVMAAIGLGDTDPDPWAGWYGRSGGVLDGWAWEYAGYEAFSRIRALIPPEQIAPQLNAVLAGMAKLGVTSVQTIDFFDDEASYAALLAETEPPARVRVICAPFDYEDSLTQCGPAWLNPFAKVRLAGIKWLSDGTPVERLSAMNDDYSDWPGWDGLFNFPLEDWYEMVADALQFPVIPNQRVIHAIGDRTTENLLDAMEAMAPDWQWRFHRPRIEHAEFVSRYAPRLAAKNMVAVYNPTHHSFPQLFVPRYGERTAEMYRMRTVKEAGVRIALGSDGFGVINPMTGEGAGANPFLDIFLAVLNPANPTEGLTVEEAVDAYTHGSVVAEFMELFKGTIAVGKLADYAILSQNIFDPALLMAIPATHSVRTVCGGEDTFVLPE